jgi:hypothetical protein
VKLALVAIAVTYHFAVHRKRMLAASASTGLRISAGISMTLWLAAILAGLEVGSFT